ncbi:hypothetical protein FisN_1Hh650 [Fistulifera solaris]|uniref:Uncharacterized protein n=1 Tax=Fistulifera solaris TaxID=1519565 RepID=A0A1Z5KQH1_FISSO|nr:hypothetical protein FisN_1Hh650 [Fistulifera solaris]|eukprot:GAX28560.1 hypothetical protein FisN_1Hh650 [Fistulifera solaris]
MVAPAALKVSFSTSIPQWQNTTDMSFSYSNNPSYLSQRVAEQPEIRVYCDLDGVLVDFEAGIRSIFPDLPKEFSSFHIPVKRSTMWQKVKEADAFFERLPWTRDGKRLWQAIRHLQPDILTGVPNHPSSRVEKLRWCERELGVQVNHIDMAGHFRTHLNMNGRKVSTDKCNVITCWSDNKHYESGPNAVLIDDRLCLREKWEAAGGIFVHHDGDMDMTLEKLRQIGLIAGTDNL